MSADVAAGILRERCGVTGPVVVHETWGASVVVEIDNLFLKANGDYSTTAETLVARLVRAAGVPAPEIIGNGIDARLPGGKWIVMPRMPGTAFDAGNATPAQIDTAIADVARNLTMLCDVRMPGYGSVDDEGRGTSASWAAWLYGQLTESAQSLVGRLPEGFVDTARRAIDAIPELERGSVLNADLGLSHVFVDPTTGSLTGLLDWAAAVIGDPLFDVATFSMGGPADDPTPGVLQPLLLAAYGADPGDPRIRLYRAINHLSNAVWSVENDVLSWTDDLCRAAVELLQR